MNEKSYFGKKEMEGKYEIRSVKEEGNKFIREKKKALEEVIEKYKHVRKEMDPEEYEDFKSSLELALWYERATRGLPHIRWIEKWKENFLTRKILMIGTGKNKKVY